MNAALTAALAAGNLRSVDLHLARHLLAAAGCRDPQVALAVALLSRAGADGDVCLDLATLAGQPVLPATATTDTTIAPPLADWRTALLASGLVMADGDDTPRPLVLAAGHRLYLQRHHAQEQAIAAALRARLQPADGVDSERLRAGLARHFPGAATDDRQRLAAALALLRRCTVIAGGPGTGKTTTVARILALLLEQHTDGTPPVIRLAAPTGKAAARLSQSIRQARERLRLASDAQTLAAIPEDASTLHRLLGARGDAGARRYTHDAGNPLVLDVLVVDEASMIDLGLMAALLDALPPEARLILLGDRDQLASVEAGNVLGDICNRGAPFAWTPALRAQLQSLGLSVPADSATTTPVPMADSLVVLTQSHRFGPDSGIGRIARAVNAGQLDDTLFAGNTSHAGDESGAGNDSLATHEVRWAAPDAHALSAAVDDMVARHWLDWRRTDDPVDASTRFDGFRFLCALRDGDYGVARINRLVEQALQRRGLIDPRTPHYAGRPLLVTRNDPGTGLFNGDTGLVLPDADGTLRAFFVQPDGTVRHVALNRLPAHETAYALTVHKSQGSEFGHVTLVLPAQDNPVLTRELVYTGITRARQGITLWAPRAVLARAVERRVQRNSGLHDALWRTGQLAHPDE